MFKKFNYSLLVAVCALFISIGSVNAEEWLYRRIALASRHTINFDGSQTGISYLHQLEDVSDGTFKYAYCADVDAGGFTGTYVKRLVTDSDYNGNGKKMMAILSSSYPFISVDEMKSLYREQMGNDKYTSNGIANLTYQEAVTATQAAVWSVSNPNHSNYLFGKTITNDDIINDEDYNKRFNFFHSRIGLTCDWTVTDSSEDGYCYPNQASTKVETDETVSSKRVNAIISWLLSLDGSLIDGSGEVGINVISKEMVYDTSKEENVVNVSFNVETDGLTRVSSLSDIEVVVTDSNGNNIDVDYSDGVYSFKELYPGDMKQVSYVIKVNYNSTYGVKAYLYEAGGQQDLISVEPSNVSKDASINVDINRTSVGDVEISKVAVTGGPELPGAKLTIKDSEGNIIDSWVSTDEVHVVKGLSEGKYTLTEEIAPEGYATASTIEFEIKDGEVTSVEMVDQVTKVLISKKDFTTEEEVVGAKLQILDSEGNIVHEWISSNEPHYIEKLPVGSYTLIETVYPDGYEEGMIIDGILVSKYEFEVEDTGEIQTIDVYNRTTTITDVPKTGIHKSMTLGLSIIVIGCGVIVVSRKKNA